MRAAHLASLQLLLVILLSSSPSVSCQNQSTTASLATGNSLREAGSNGTSSRIPGWAGMILNAANQFSQRVRNQSSAGNGFDGMRQLLSLLPGLAQGLAAVDPQETDVGKILAGLFSNPGLTNLPKWIRDLMAGASNTSVADMMQNFQNLAQVISTVGINNQTRNTLLEALGKVGTGISSLNLSDNAAPQDVLSAILSRPDLLQSLTPETMQTLGQISGSVNLPSMLSQASPQSGGPSGLSQISSMLAAASGLKQLFPTIPGSQCAADLDAFGTALLQRQRWALEMLDAMGKPVAGLLTGQNVLVGDFDQCVDISVKNGSRAIEGQFCNMAFTVPGALSGVIPPFAIANLYMHLCLPKSCSEMHLYQLFQPALENIGSTHQGIQCHHSPDPTEDSWFVGTVATLAVLAALCLAGTIYSAVLDSKKDQRKPETSFKTTGHVNTGYVSDEKGGLTNGKTGFPEGNDANGGLTNGKVLFSDHVSGGLTNGKETKLEMTQAEGKENGEGVREGVNGRDNSGSGTAARQTAPNESLLSKLLLSFSVLRNGRKVLNTEQSRGDISCLHGIRTLSITWVIVGHCFSMLVGTPALGNKTSYFNIMSSFSAMVVPGGFYAVDTFFLLSGCLTAFLFLRSTQKTGVTVSGMVLYYVHRIWRLTPLYALLLATYAGVFPYLKNGPFEHVYIGVDSLTTCRKYWHYNLLYVNNLVDNSMEKLCFGWSWYLSNDMQFYILAPIVLIPWTVKNGTRIVGFLLCAAMVLTHCISTGVISHEREATIFRNNGDFMQHIYFVPWCRVGPYAVGLVLGYIMHVTKGKYTMDKLSVFLGWTIATGVGLTLVYVLYDNVKDLTHGYGWTLDESIAYWSLNKVLWAVCVSWVIFACHNGYGGFVNTLMSWGAWAPLSRLTYGVYLVHLIIMFILSTNYKKPFYLDEWSVTALILAVTVLSYLVSFFFSMLIEAPTLGLEKAVLGKLLRNRR